MMAWAAGKVPLAASEASDFPNRRLCGTVESCFIARCRRTGRSRGYGFVKFATPAEARVAQQNVTG